MNNGSIRKSLVIVALARSTKKDAARVISSSTSRWTVANSIRNPEVR